MKIYMYNNDEAKKNNCGYVKEPVVFVLILTFIFLILLSITISLSSKIEVYVSEFLGFVPWLFLAAVTAYGFDCCIKEITLRTLSGHTAFIKENGVLWAVRLTYIHFPRQVVNHNLTTALLTLKPAIEDAKSNNKLKSEFYNRIVDQNSFYDGLVEAQNESNIMVDVDKNFRFVFNGKASVIRLDDIKFIRETKRTEIYSYINHKGETTLFRIAKAYPGLREEVSYTKHINHEFPFPRYYKESIKNNPLLVFYICLAIFLGPRLLFSIINYFLRLFEMIMSS